MDHIDRQIYEMILHDCAESTKRQLDRVDKALLRTKKLPSEIYSSILFIGCVYLYLIHGLRLPLQIGIGCIILLEMSCLLALLSLYVRKGGLSQLRAVLCLLCSFFLIFQLNFP